MFPQVARSGLSFTKVLTGINKTLNVANQIIPIYVQAKPMIQNMKSAFKVAKSFMNTPKNETKSTNTSKNKAPVKTTIQKTNSSPTKVRNNPVFFIS